MKETEIMGEVEQVRDGDGALAALCDLTVRLTELRMREVPHLFIENFAPQLLARLIRAEQWANDPLSDPDGGMPNIVKYGI